MKRQYLRIFALLACLGLAGGLPAFAAPLPGDSIYHLDASLTDQHGKARKLADTQGKPVIAAMFYASCKFVCPLIIDSVRKTERALAPAQREGIEVVLISLDPDRDTPAVLNELAHKRHVDSPHWHLMRAPASDVRRIAAVLGVQYKQLEDGEFSHSSALVLLDAQGRILARSEKLGEADPEFVGAVQRALATP
ncbi:SCO family protein [Dokdonella sp.]|uniref:SCO family protein n=1 Tax=Dokdonella sp. TaxID=2291710 RepID=UPI0025C03A1C|nr:SCO family protein [Dokdonella sp.]MBX3690042.1 SCO family protein [Dokdonella sp.]